MIGDGATEGIGNTGTGRSRTPSHSLIRLIVAQTAYGPNTHTIEAYTHGPQRRGPSAVTLPVLP
jgi:hypothetical protein